MNIGTFAFAMASLGITISGVSGSGDLHVRRANFLTSDLKQFPDPANIEFDEAITPTGNDVEELLFGDGNDNGGFTTDRRNGLEIGLRTKSRFPKANTFNSNGDGIYKWPADAADCASGGSPGWCGATTPAWSFEWGVNTDLAGDNGKTVGDYCYELGMDADPSSGTDFTSFDPITPTGTVPAFDHAFGNNTSVNDDRAAILASCGSTDSAMCYANLLSTYNAAQQSWNYEFFNNQGSSLFYFDPTVDGSYIIYLRAFDCDTKHIAAETFIQVLTGDAFPVFDVELPPLSSDDDDNGGGGSSSTSSGSKSDKKCNDRSSCSTPLDREFSQDVTPDVIFGTGNGNGFFTTNRQDGIEVGLRGKVRFAGEYNDNSDGVYSMDPGGETCFAVLDCAFWNFEWSVNTDFDDSTGKTVGDFCYELGMDADPSDETSFASFDPITPTDGGRVPDHGFGNNTSSGDNSEEATTPTEYATLLDTYNVVQQSWNFGFFTSLPMTSLQYFDNALVGSYIVYFRVLDCECGNIVAETFIEIRVGDVYPTSRTTQVCLPEAEEKKSCSGSKSGSSGKKPKPQKGKKPKPVKKGKKIRALV